MRSRPHGDDPIVVRASSLHAAAGRIIAACIAFALALPALAADPIPADKRIVGTITRTIAPPPTTRPMHMPTDVAVDSKDRVYVADGVNERILRFAPDGAIDPTHTHTTLNRPVGIFVDASDNLWIADTRNRRIVSGPTIVDLPKDVDPTDLALTPDGKRLYVVDNDGHRVLVRDMPGGEWKTLGSPGRALGQFQWPFMIALDKENYAYVTEAIGARAQSISPNDKWAGEIAKWGVEAGQVYRPKGIAADPATGNLFISDSSLGVVQSFSPRGGFRGVLTDAAGQPLRFKHPMGLAFDKDNNLYVVELAAHRVAIVKLEAKPK